MNNWTFMVAGFGCFSSSLPAATVMLAAVADNTLYDDGAGLISNGAGQHLFAGTSGSNGIRRALVVFDVASAVPAGATIDSVSLGMVASRESGGSQMLTLHRTTSDWGEGSEDAGGNEGGGAAALLGTATWLDAFSTTTAWMTAGGDFAATASATSATGLGAFSWASTTELVGDVQSMLDDPILNFGWLIRGNETAAGNILRFESRENAESTDRPLLTIEYSDAIPEPSAVMLIFMSSACLLRRFR